MGKFRRLAKRTFIGVSLLALSLGVVAGAGGALVFYRAQPSYNGQDKIPGLSAPVQVYRDSYGVPHIFAANGNDAARALGYAHASERLFQMEMQRRAGQGRLSEIIGPDMLGVDKFVRTMGFYALAQSSFDAMSPEAQDTFRAYADGVNAWLAGHINKLPPEFLLLGDRPEPWTPADSVVWGKLMALELSHNYHLEILRAKLATKIAPEKIAELFPPPPAGTPVTTQPSLLPSDTAHRSENERTDGISILSSLDDLDPYQKALAFSGNADAALAGKQTGPDVKLATLLGLDHAASNEWVIGGTRTQSGKPILANDPHLGLEAPILWYLARIVTPQGSVKGATVPGLPLVLLGQNDHLAWGFTTTGSDVEDLFIETVDPQNADHYLTPQGSELFSERTEVIHVKNAPDVILKVRLTRHGPVLSDVSAEVAAVAGAGKVIALAFTGLGGKDRTSESLLRINQAHTAAELIDALKIYEAPPQNIVYADDQGAFGYINAGIVPVRKSGDGLMPVDGASGDYDWTGIVPFAQVPQIANPDAGYVFNANNAIVASGTTPYFGQDWEEPYRARRLQQIFDSHEKFTLERSAKMQADHLSLAATDFLPRLLALTPRNDRMKQALEMLQGWDGTMDADRPEPAIFESWLYVLHQRLFAKTGVDLSGKGPFAAMTLDSLLTDHAQEWCGDADCRALMLQSLDDALDLMTLRQGTVMVDWRWGHENVATLKHKFYSHIPLLSRLSDLSVESSGDFYTLDRGGGFDNKIETPFARTHGGGFRGIYDLADPDASLFMIATGESGHILSRHYGDMVPLWNNVKSITLAGSEDQLKQNGDAELVLEP